jgi:hypothetical protein
VAGLFVDYENDVMWSQVVDTLYWGDYSLLPSDTSKSVSGSKNSINAWLGMFILSMFEAWGDN